MKLCSSGLAIPFLTCLLACAGAQSSEESSMAQETPPTGSDDDPRGSSEAPVQLGEYPGAPYEDSKGNLWFSIFLEGLLMYDGEKMVTYTTENGLPNNQVRDLVEAEDGKLWIATGSGVSIYDGQTFTSLTNYVDTPLVQTFNRTGDHREVWDILQDRNGDWWIATLAGVFRYDGTSFSPFPLPVVAKKGAYEFTPKMVYSIYEGQDGMLWFATDGAGAVSYDGEKMTVYTEESHGLASNRVCKILEDSRGAIWFGTSGGGVGRYDGESFTTHLRSKTFSKHTGWGRYMSIHEDRGGDVWFGASMAGGGVYRWNGESFRYYSEKDGLGSGGVPSIKEDRAGRLWFGTTSGVYHFDGERFINFTKKG